MLLRGLLAAALAAVCWVGQSAWAEAPKVRHVVVIGLDGARADAIREHAGPALRKLIDGGAVCWDAQAQHPTVTQVNWASILTGCTPQKHGIDKHPITEAELAGKRVKVTSVLDVVGGRGGNAVAFLGHWKLYPVEDNPLPAADTELLVSPTTRRAESGGPGAHFVHSPYDAKLVAGIAAKRIVAEKPEFTFVYMGDLDGAGHKYGWMSEQYINRINDVDAGIQTVVNGVKEAKLEDSTLIIVTSDHGGHDKGHGEGTVEDSTVPWIVCGPGVRKGVEIAGPMFTMTTAPTALWALGLPIPQQWEGKAAVEAFLENAER
jgi:predicted AlkP superfamily pyrophosphatase or phosphodiesterase